MHKKVIQINEIYATRLSLGESNFFVSKKKRCFPTTVKVDRLLAIRDRKGTVTQQRCLFLVTLLFESSSEPVYVSRRVERRTT